MKLFTSGELPEAKQGQDCSPGSVRTRLGRGETKPVAEGEQDSSTETTYLAGAFRTCVLSKLKAGEHILLCELDRASTQTVHTASLVSRTPESCPEMDTCSASCVTRPK